MAQVSDYTIANASGSAVRTDLNNVFAAIQSTNIGSSAPSGLAAGMLWIDNSATPWILNLYDGSDSIAIAKINISTNKVESVAATQEGGIVFNEASADVDFRVESNASAHMLFVDGGNNEVLIDASNSLTTADGTLHVHTNTAGSIAANSLADDLVVENNAHGGISILTPNSTHGYIMFGDQDSNSTGQIQYDHATPAWQYIFEGANRLYFSGTETVINEGGNDFDFRVEGDTLANVIFCEGSTSRICLGTATSTAGASGARVIVDSAIFPATDDARDLGHASFRWDDVYATNTTISSSDERIKQDISDSDLGYDFVKALKPRSYKLQSGSRTHYGMIAQEVAAACETLKKSTDDFAGYIKSPVIEGVVDDDGKPVMIDELDKNGNVVTSTDIRDGEMVEVTQKVQATTETGDHTYGLRYSEFIAPIISTLQTLIDKVEALENK